MVLVGVRFFGLDFGYSVFRGRTGVGEVKFKVGERFKE